MLQKYKKLAAFLKTSASYCLKSLFKNSYSNHIYLMEIREQESILSLGKEAERKKENNKQNFMRKVRLLRSTRIDSL